MTVSHTPPVDAQDDPDGQIDDITIGWQIDHFTDFLEPVSPKVARVIAGQFPITGTDDMARFAVTGHTTPDLAEQVTQLARGQHGWAKTRLLALAAYLESAT